MEELVGKKKEDYRDQLFKIFNEYIVSGEKLAEFIKFRNSFNMADYSFKNQLLLMVQSKMSSCTPFFATMKQWNERGNKVNIGSKAYQVVTPINMFTVNTKNKDKQQILKDLDAVVKENKGKCDYTNMFVKIFFNYLSYKKDDREAVNKSLKEHNIELLPGKTFRPRPILFSIDQTNMPEKERAALIQRYDTKEYNPEEGKKVYEILKDVANRLDISVVEDNEEAQYSGYLNLRDKKIYVIDSAPIESKCSILAHELGHYITQKNIDNFNSKYVLDKSNYEIQAELFSALFSSQYDILRKDIEVEKNGEVHLEKELANEFSTRYISGYLDSLKSSIKREFKLKSKKITNDKIDLLAKKYFYYDFEICDLAIQALNKTISVIKDNKTELIDESINNLRNFKAKEILINFDKEEVYTKNTNVVNDLSIFPSSQDQIDVENTEKLFQDYTEYQLEKENTLKQWQNSAQNGILISEDLYDHYTNVIKNCDDNINDIELHHPEFKERFSQFLSKQTNQKESENEMEM